MIGNKGLFVLLLSIALFAQISAKRYGHAEGTNYTLTESKQRGGGEDDWHEATDVQYSRNFSSKVDVLADPAYCAKANQTIVDISTETSPSDITEEVQIHTIVNPNGTITNEKVVVRVNKTKKVMTYKIATFWSKTYKVISVKQVILDFVDTYAKETTAADLALFNNIATTDGNRFASAYNYLQVKAENLEAVVRSSISILQVKVTEDDIQEYIKAIRDCNTTAIIRTTATEKIDIMRDDAWTVYAEFYAASCTKGAKGYQLYTFTANKSGAWLPNVCKTPAHLVQAFNVIRNILKPWLWRYAGLMFTCTKAPIQKPCYGNDKPVSAGN